MYIIEYSAVVNPLTELDLEKMVELMTFALKVQRSTFENRDSGKCQRSKSIVESSQRNPFPDNYF